MSNRRPNATTFFIREELLRRGFSVHLFDQSQLCIVQKDGKHFFFSSSKMQFQNQMGFWISENKYLTKKVLEYFDLPTAKGMKISASSLDEVESLHFPIVLKPLSMNGGMDVQVGIKSKDDIRTYFERLPQYKELLAEETLSGTDLRVLIIGGKFFAAVKRVPAFVIGDGTHTIQELVEIENVRRFRIFQEDESNRTFSTDLDLILFDAIAEKAVSSYGYATTDVPVQGERVYVRSNANTSTGGISVDMTDQVCMEIRKQCEEVASCLAMTIAGIDIMTADLSRPLSIERGSGVVEVNASPGLDLHILTDEGQRRNPVPLIVDEIEKYF